MQTMTLPCTNRSDCWCEFCRCPKHGFPLRTEDSILTACVVCVAEQARCPVCGGRAGLHRDDCEHDDDMMQTKDFEANESNDK